MNYDRNLVCRTVFVRVQIYSCLVSRDDGGNALIAFIVRQFSDLNLT